MVWTTNTFSLEFISLVAQNIWTTKQCANKTKTLNHGSKWAKHPNLVTRPQVSPIETTTNGEFSKHATYQVKFPGTALAIAPVVKARVFDSIDRGLVLLCWFKRQAMWMQMGGSQNGAPKWNKNKHIGKINADHWICGYLIFRYNHIWIDDCFIAMFGCTTVFCNTACPANTRDDKFWKLEIWTHLLRKEKPTRSSKTVYPPVLSDVALENDRLYFHVSLW